MDGSFSLLDFAEPDEPAIAYTEDAVRATTVRAFDLSTTIWRKSGRSNGGDDQSNCVEVAELPGRVAMRDSKDPARPVLAFTHTEWRAFLDGIRASELS